MPFTSASTCWSVNMPPALIAKGGMCVPGSPLVINLTDDLVIHQRLIRGISQRVGRAVHSLGAMATGAVLGVERSKVQH